MVSDSGGLDEDGTLEALERLVLDSDSFAPLENNLADFNVFEALGHTYAENRHSNFLAFLLDPNGSHGLGDIVLRSVIQRALKATSKPIDVISFSMVDLDNTLVLREHQNIDIFAVNDEKKFTLVIENKIRSTEHSRQLQRYREHVEREYADYENIYLYLTPNSEEPSDENYLPFSYVEVAEIVERLVELPTNKISQNVRSTLEQYLQILRRYIVSDEKMIELARSYYQKHKTALDFIFEQRPDLQLDLSDYLTSLIEEQKLFRLDRKIKSFVNFSSESWNNIQIFESISESEWTKTGKGILFEFRNSPTVITLALVIGPLENQSDRQVIFEYCKSEPEIFVKGSPKLYAQYSTLWSKQIISKKDIESAESVEDLKPKIDSSWQKFIDNDFPKLDEMFKVKFE
jgi:hypothetical protein